MIDQNILKGRFKLDGEARLSLRYQTSRDINLFDFLSPISRALERLLESAGAEHAIYERSVFAYISLLEAIQKRRNWLKLQNPELENRAQIPQRIRQSQPQYMLEVASPAEARSLYVLVLIVLGCAIDFTEFVI